jgi:hypothetical protein
MLYILKGLYFEYKVRAYEKGIMALQRGRDSLKAKQAKATVRREAYVTKLQSHKTSKGA